MANIYYNLQDGLSLTNTSSVIEDEGTYIGTLSISNANFRDKFKYDININITHDGTYSTSYTYDYISGELRFNVRDGEYRVEITYDLTSDLKMYLMTNFLEKNRLNKEGGLSLIKIVEGTFRDETNVVNPSILVELDTFPKTLNYVYISLLDRFYYVTNLTLVNKNLYEIELEEDVLMSHQSEIYIQKVFVERNENEYNETFPDTYLTPVNGYNVGEVIVSNNLFGKLGDTDQSSQNFLITGLKLRITEYQGDYEGYTDRTEGWLSTYIPGKINAESDFVGAVAVNKRNAEKLVNMFTTGNIFNLANFFFEDSREYITSFQWFPFAIPITEGGYLEMPGLDASDLTDSNKVYGYIPQFKKNGKRIFDLGGWDSSTYENRFNDFRDYEGYTKITAFLPYIGFVDLPCNDYYSEGKCLRFFLEMDFISGLGTYYVCVSDSLEEDLSTCRIILIKSVQLGYNIPIGKTNAVEVFRNVVLSCVKGANQLLVNQTPTTINTETTKSSIGGGTTSVERFKHGTKHQPSVVSTKTTKPEKTTTSSTTTYSTKKGIIDSTAQLANGILSNLFITPQSDSPNSSNSLFLASQDIIIVIKQPKYIIERDENYKKLFGLPLREIKTISQLSGYTIISDVHLELTCLSEEEVMIEDALLNGIII